jgi:hypothetical protein
MLQFVNIGEFPKRLLPKIQTYEKTKRYTVHIFYLQSVGNLFVKS